MKNVRFNVVESKIVLDKKKDKKKVKGALNIILFLLIMVSTLISLGWVWSPKLVLSQVLSIALLVLAATQGFSIWEDLQDLQDLQARQETKTLWNSLGEYTQMK